MFAKWHKWWQLNAGTEAQKAIKARDWEAVLILSALSPIESVLEFGAGLSTILFSQVFPRVVAFETNASYAEWLRPHCPDAEIIHWNNLVIPEPPGSFDFALVDGILPRRPQAEAALRYTKVIGIHDPRASGRDAIPVVEHLPELDCSSPYMRLFHNEEKVS